MRGKGGVVAAIPYWNVVPLPPCSSIDRTTFGNFFWPFSSSLLLRVSIPSESERREWRETFPPKFYVLLPLPPSFSFLLFSLRRISILLLLLLEIGGERAANFLGGRGGGGDGETFYCTSRLPFLPLWTLYSHLFRLAISTNVRPPAFELE